MLKFSGKELNVVAFNIPAPPNFGGAIDAFFALKAFHKLGVKVNLHCFEYNRPRNAVLGEMCASVSYYPREMGWKSFFSLVPQLIKSRRSDLLRKNLLSNGHPILFFGIHTCHDLSHVVFFNRVKGVRPFNVESDYYGNLAGLVKHPGKRLFFRLEAFRLKRFEPRLASADHLFPISRGDLAKMIVWNRNAKLIPAFHPHDAVDILPGKGQYALFHGDLSIQDNHLTAEHLIKEVFSDLPYPLIIAGRNPRAGLRTLVEGYSNVTLKRDPSSGAMDDLLKNAHVHMMLAFQSSGFKLKLLSSLFRGRFCIANREMVRETGLEDLCRVADTAAAQKRAAKEIFLLDFELDEIEKRKEGLLPAFSNVHNAERLLAPLFSES